MVCIQALEERKRFTDTSARDQWALVVQPGSSMVPALHPTNAGKRKRSISRHTPRKTAKVEAPRNNTQDDDIKFLGHRPASRPRPLHNTRETAIVISDDDESDYTLRPRTAATSTNLQVPSASSSRPTIPTVRKNTLEVTPGASQKTGGLVTPRSTAEPPSKRRKLNSSTPSTGRHVPPITPASACGYVPPVTYARGSIHDPIILDASEEDIRVLFSDEDERPEEGTGEDDDDGEGEEETEYGFSDYENAHAGFVIPWSNDALEEEVADSEEEDEAIPGLHEALEKLSLNYLPLHPHPIQHARMLDQGQLPRGKIQFKYKLSHLSAALLPRTVPPVVKQYRTGPHRHRAFRRVSSNVDESLLHLKIRETIRMADTCISISQSGRTMAMASSTPGGNPWPDEDGLVAERSVYNSSDTLAIWRKETGLTRLEDHFEKSHDPNSSNYYWDIWCARLDPINPDILVSSSLNGEVKMQMLSTEDGLGSDIFMRNHTPEGSFCHDIVYKPSGISDRSVFATPCTNGKIYITSYNPNSPDGNLYLSHQTLQHEWSRKQRSGATVWGTGASEGKIFVSAEMKDNATPYHGWFDVERGEFTHFNHHRDGGEMVLNPSGTMLAMFSSGPEMRLYDLKSSSPRSTHCISLPSRTFEIKLPDNAEPDVGSTSWSPDELLLAVGMNYDETYIYDVRNLGRVLFTLYHEVPKSKYGVQILEWGTRTSLRKEGLGLFVGGSDGCVALWDTKTACAERRVIAEVGGAVSYGHFGDVGRGEMPLVVGDETGHVYIFDFPSAVPDL